MISSAKSVAPVFFGSHWYRTALRQQILLALASGPVRIRTLMDQFGCDNRAMRRRLETLRRHKLVTRKGFGPVTWWMLVTYTGPLPTLSAGQVCRARRPTRSVTVPSAPATSWWLTADRQQFQQAAADRARQAGWNA